MNPAPVKERSAAHSVCHEGPSAPRSAGISRGGTPPRVPDGAGRGRMGGAPSRVEPFNRLQSAEHRYADHDERGSSNPAEPTAIGGRPGTEPGPSNEPPE